MTRTGESCAYVTSRYPGLTHTFVVGEVRALRARGVRVETATIRRVPDHEVLSAVDREERDRAQTLLPVTPVQLLSAHARALRQAPVAYLRTLLQALQFAHAGGRPRLWQLFYFTEAVLLRDWMAQRQLRHAHVHLANAAADVAMLACSLANAAGAPRPWTWSLTVHGPDELHDVTTHKLALKAAHAAAVLCISDFSRSQVAALVGPATAARLHTVRCGVDVEAFAPPPPGTREGREILYVGALQARKGVDVLLEAMAGLRTAHPQARLTIVGDGEQRLALEAQARSLRLESAVRFAGAVAHDRLPALYATADVFCLPSFAEGVPTVLMEAMATELPVVSTAVMGTPELVEHELSGLLVAPGRSDLLADALARLLADAELRARMGAAGRRRILAAYDRRASAAEVHRVLAPFLGP